MGRVKVHLVLSARGRGHAGSIPALTVDGGFSRGRGKATTRAPRSRAYVCNFCVNQLSSDEPTAITR